MNSKDMTDTMIRPTEYGLVSGIRRNGCICYLGIPFAQPPVGDLAFRHPAEPDTWDGVYQAADGKANPIQSPGTFSSSYNSQDCLYLNIYIPEYAAAQEALTIPEAPGR